MSFSLISNRFGEYRCSGGVFLGIHASTALKIARATRTTIMNSNKSFTISKRDRFDNRLGTRYILPFNPAKSKPGFHGVGARSFQNVTKYRSKSQERLKGAVDNYVTAAQSNNIFFTRPYLISNWKKRPLCNHFEIISLSGGKVYGCGYCCAE